mgnify:CR=1 FL=1
MESLCILIDVHVKARLVSNLFATLLWFMTPYTINLFLVFCTRCIRVCDEIEGAHVWDLAYRGAECKVVTGLNQPWGEVSACTDCGKCVDACPTGAIFRKGMTVAEMERDRAKLDFLVTAREKREWTR